MRSAAASGTFLAAAVAVAVGGAAAAWQGSGGAAYGRPMRLPCVQTPAAHRVPIESWR